MLISDYNYYQKIKNIPFHILFYANQYELLTFQFTKYLYRNNYSTKNNKYKNIDFEYNYFPIPIGYELSFNGNKQVYLIDIKNKLPKKQNIVILKMIGPAEFNNNNQLNVINDEQYILTNFNHNIVKSYYLYYHHNYNNSKFNKKNVLNIQNNIQNSNKYDIIFINEFSIKKKFYKNNELNSLPFRINIIQNGLNLLNNNGDLYLEYFNVSDQKTLDFLYTIFSKFKSIKFIRSKLYDNSLSGGYYIFYHYNSTNNFDKKYFTNFIQKTQNNIYHTFKNYIDKCNMLLHKMKNNDYYKNYQISVGVDWCKSHKIQVSKYYTDYLYKLNDLNLIKSIFYQKPNIDYSKIKLYYDTFYSITYYEEGITLSQIIKKYFPNINTIIDANANIGGSTITLAHYFNKIISIEIEKERFGYLVNNVHIYKLKNVECLNIDYNHYNRNKNDLVFFDPPWGGIFYKSVKQLELFLGNTNIKKYLIKNTIIKVPYNYNLKNIKHKFIIEKLKGFMLLIFI
jgi:16S rRNA G966 N2-methylase RsmD